MLGHLEQLLGSVESPVDPVGASGEGEVAVGIDHARDDGRTSRVDHTNVRWEVALIRCGMDPGNTSIVHEDAHAFLEGWSCPVCEGSISIEYGSRLRHGFPGMRRLAKECAKKVPSDGGDLSDIA